MNSSLPPQAPSRRAVSPPPSDASPSRLGTHETSSTPHRVNFYASATTPILSRSPSPPPEDGGSEKINNTAGGMKEGDAMSPSAKEISNWIAGKNYMRYDIGRSSAGSAKASSSRPTPSPVTREDRVGGLFGSSIGGGAYTTTSGPGLSPNNSKRYNIGIGIAVSASHPQSRSSGRGEDAAPTNPHDTGVIATASVTSSPQAHASRSSVANSSSATRDEFVSNSSHPNTRETDALAARARLIQRRDQMQLALDSRGSQYVSKIGKLSTTWMLAGGDKKSRKAATYSPPRSGQTSPDVGSRAVSRGGNDAKGDGRVGGNNHHHQVSLNTTVNSLLFSSSSLGGKGVDRTADDDSTTNPPPSVVRQHLAGSFAAVHLSPNSNTVVIHENTNNNKSNNNNHHAFGSTVNSTVASPRSPTGSPRTKAPAEGMLDGVGTLNETLNATSTSTASTSPQQRVGSSKGLLVATDVGAHPSAVRLQRSTSPPLDALHGGCHHNQQQQPRLFPALLGPYANPNYYVRKDGATRQQLQARKDRPPSPLRHGNPQGVPLGERPYSPNHDVVRDAPFRVCGSESYKPVPRARPEAGPPLFYSPGTLAAAKRTYISSNPMAYQ